MEWNSAKQIILLLGGRDLVSVLACCVSVWVTVVCIEWAFASHLFSSYNIMICNSQHETCTDPKLITELALLLPRCTVQN